MDFINLVLNGMATIEEVDDYVEAWHESLEDNQCELHDYLGMSEDEYFEWCRDPQYIHVILLKRAKLIETINKYRESPALFVEEFLNIKLHRYQKLILDNWYKLRRS